MERAFENKTVFITGAAAGIGLEIVRKFASQGAHVILTDKDGEKAHAVSVELRKTGFQVTGMACDVSQEEDIKAAIDHTILQNGRLDILVNNAGFQHVSLIEDFPTGQFEAMIKVMLTAPFITTKLAFPIMKKQNFGRIINMSSINGIIGFAGKAAYNSAKHGLIGLTKVTALEGAAWGITANAVCPGYVDTELVRGQLQSLATTRGISEEDALNDVILAMVPQKRLLTKEEIAASVTYLCTDSARGITGQSIIIDGGYTVG